ncbi:hypothetical protein [Phenylobacterium soli]|uniref:Uncharacterized protein n=1 Tax=Phenylobacterium soli TaxID=2170551 RepID=A0A328AQM2_9CAUL|nr:hypothetical protein [Phenylobacterium soli]RAK55804.1 hypothetical protein DJ017_15440 [Phenylobacterium soli]
MPRVVAAGLEASLERFSDRTLLAAGKVNLISVEAVEQRFGARWALRQEQVYGFTQRILERGLGPRGLFLRVSETDFLIVQPDLGRLAGQAACLRYLREILEHFLGDSHLAPKGILQVTRIAPGALDAKQVDLAAVTRMADEVAAAPAPAAPAAAEAAPAPRPRIDQWSPFVSADGRQLRVSATLEPVYELKGFTRIGFRMNRRVIVTRTGEALGPAALADLSAAELLRIDLATVARGIDRVRADSSGQQQLSLIVPLSYASLSSARGRAELIQPLREAGGLVSCGAICEILDIEGAPAGALSSVVAMVKPFALLVVGRLNTGAGPLLARLAGAGLRALSIECPQGLSDTEFALWATQTIRSSKRVAPSVMVYGVSSERRAGELGVLGATHVSLRLG